MFNSIQGEGRFAGYPATFIRLAGCNLNCEWCDTKYARGEGIMTDFPDAMESINRLTENRKYPIVVFTGGEPMLQFDSLLILYNHYVRTCRDCFDSMSWHLETNGTIIPEQEERYHNLSIFNYICFSPKNTDNIENILAVAKQRRVTDIKVVTDLKTVGMDLLEYATILMPLSTYKAKEDKEIRQKVWQYCVDHDLRYSPRLQQDIWGKKRCV